MKIDLSITNATPEEIRGLLTGFYAPLASTGHQTVMPLERVAP